MRSKENRSVVITGASSGIGYASVSRMIESGWQVFATVRKSQDGDRLRSGFGSRLVPLIMDVTDRSSITAAAQEVSHHLDAVGLDGLVNVAGIGRVRPVEFITEDDLRQIFEINVFGQLAVTQAFLPLLHKAPRKLCFLELAPMNLFRMDISRALQELFPSISIEDVDWGTDEERHPWLRMKYPGSLTASGLADVRRSPHMSAHIAETAFSYPGEEQRQRAQAVRDLILKPAQNQLLFRCAAARA